MKEELKQPNFSPLALDILRDRYLWRDAEGNVTETPQEMLYRVAKHVASAEKPEDRTYWTSKYYAIMADLDFLPNSPTLMNAGRPYPHGQLAACFVVGIEDSMESICGALRKQMLIHKTGGGTGFNFSKLRPKGANVNSTNGKASGPVSFMRLFDLSTEVVQQGGCFTGDTLIATAEGPVKISELKEGMLVYSHHPEKGFILTPCTAPFMTRRDTQIMELETDNGLKIRATPDHPFMYRSGFAFREKGFGKLCDLPIGTPLMSLTTYVKKGYRFITLQDGKDSRMPLHRWLAEQGGKSGSVIHHINGNCLDNRLSNLTNEFDKALAYADERNCKVAAKSLCGRADVWNVEIPETHNYVVCNADGTAGVVVSNTRRGANMAILNCDHPDIEEFISCKDNEGKITNFNLSVGITDEFMKRACDDPTSSAAALLHKIAEHAWKSGDPGVVFLDIMNRDNPCPELGRIESTNPCVTGETCILTDKGYRPIADCVGEKIKVWNGHEWSEVEPHVTGENQKIMRLTFSDGSELKCTPYHKFYIQRGFSRQGRQEKLEAKQLKVGDRICKTRYPILDFEKSSMTPDEAYVNGFFTGDGCVHPDGHKALSLYSKKRELVDFFARYGSVGDRSRDPINVSLTRMKTLMPKFWIPSDETLPNRLAWLAGLIDADGHRNSEDGSLSIASIHKDFLLGVRLMLNTCGIPSSVLPLKEARQNLLPDGKGGQKLYDCQTSYRLLISAACAKQLMELGFQTKCVDLTGIKPNRSAGRFVKVEKIEYCGETADKVYCFNEPICHSGMFNGILTGNCGESPLLPSEACNLGSINLAHMVTPRGEIDWIRLRDTVITAVRFLDNAIDVNQYPLPEISEAVKRTRKIGLGVMGWADMLFKLRIPYDSAEAVQLAEELMTYINTLGHVQSLELGQSKGAYIHSDSMRRNATVTCIAPTGTLALLADCSSGIEPVFSLHHTRKITLGDGTIKEVEIVNPPYADLCADTSLSDEAVAEIAKTAYQIPWKWHIDHQAAFQRGTDLAVSKTVNLPNSATVDDVIAVYVYAWEMGCKGTTIYRDGSRNSQVLTEAPVRCKECDV